MDTMRSWLMGSKHETTYAEKLELVFKAYERSLDLDIATKVVTLTPGEREKLLNDDELLARIAVLDAKNQEDMVVDLRHLIDHAESEGVKLAALKEFGRTYYPKRFKDAEVGTRTPRMIKYEIVEPVEANDTNGA
jgi:hypothetical protein